MSHTTRMHKRCEAQARGRCLCLCLRNCPRLLTFGGQRCIVGQSGQRDGALALEPTGIPGAALSVEHGALRRQTRAQSVRQAGRVALPEVAGGALAGGAAAQQQCHGADGDDGAGCACGHQRRLLLPQHGDARRLGRARHTDDATARHGRR